MENNPRINAISKLAYSIAGTMSKFYGLVEEERIALRETATQMYDLGVDISTADKAEKTDRRGFVYIITHPEWPGYVKVGRAFNPRSRLASYQTGCPHRAYVLSYAVYFEDCHMAEKEMHARLASRNTTGEWFQTSVGYAGNQIDELRSIL